MPRTAVYLMEVPVQSTTDARLIVEIDPRDVEPGMVLSGAGDGLVTKATASLDDALSALGPSLQAIKEHLRGISPEGVELEFGLKFGGETGVILAKGTAEVNLIVKLTW